MKKFLVKILLYVSLLSFIILGMNTCLIFIQKKYAVGTMGSQKNDNAEIINILDNIQICNFGNSHSYFGFNYEDAAKKYTCFNFALPSQSLRYDCKILDCYKDKLQRGATVFISLSYTAFFGRPETQEEDFEAKNMRYYKFLPPDMIDKYDIKTALCVKYFPIMRYNSFIKLMGVLRSTFQKNGWILETSPEKSDGLSRYEYHVASKFDENGRRIYKHEAVEALYKMIDICREIGAVPVFITMPYLHEYTDAVHEHDPQFFIDFHSIIDEVRKNTGVKYYDYSEDKRFSNEYKLFFNSDHLNIKGAKKFTQILLHEVLGIDPD